MSAAIESEFKKLNDLEKQFINGNINIENAVTRLAIHSIKEKLISHTIKIMIHPRKARAVEGLVNMNIIGDNTAIDTGDDPEIEMIKCREKGNQLIMRADCLDYSGSHTKACKDCHHRATTQKLLLPAHSPVPGE